MEFSNRFWRKLTKKDSVESAKYEKTVFLLIPEPVHAVFGIFFHGSGSGFSSDPDPDSGKKFDPDPGKKPGSETLHFLPIRIQLLFSIRSRIQM